MKATDKQVNYLTILTNKVNKIVDIWPECRIEKYYIDWYKERELGMTTLDASLKISAFKSLIRGINMKRSLNFNINTDIRQ